jgi:diguanylate cyclase (GGDEF)-like protein
LKKDPSAISFPDEPVSDDDVLVSLRGSATLEMLGLTSDDLMRANEDPDLLQTLRITHEVLAALRDAGVLHTFMGLPKDERANFFRWMATTDDQELRRERAAIFVLALQESPLGRPADDEVDLETPVQIGEDRDRIAADRDERAVAHDQASDARDERADARDARADMRDERSDRMDVGAAADRAGALRDRRGGASDREQAADDREAAASDRELSAQERVVSSIDALTGAYRRDAGMLELRREVERAKRTKRPLALAFVDVDGLKSKNDSAGHLEGDKLLHQIVETVRTHLRNYDPIVRFGGDEFLCAFVEVSTAEAVRRFEAVNVDLAAAAGASVTVGVAEMRSEDSLEDLIRRADEDLYNQRRRSGLS